MRKDSGAWVWLRGLGRRTIRNERAGISLSGVIYDITRHKETETQLRQKADQIEQILESTTDGVLMIDRNWRFTYMNSVAHRALSEEKNLLGRELWEALPAARQNKFQVHFLAAMTEGRQAYFEEFYPDPLNRWFEVHVYPAEEGITVFFRDITAHRDAGETLHLYRQAIEAVPLGITIVKYDHESDFPIVYTNPAFEQITGYPAHEVLGRNCRFLQSSETRDGQVVELREALHAGLGAKVTIRNHRKDGTSFLNEVQLRPVQDDQGKITHYVGVQSDVTERITIRDRLARQAKYDAVTEIPNRYLFMEHLESQLHDRPEHDKLAVIFLDVDNLKVVNDSLGHLYGDRILQAIAKRLVASVRADDVVARIGGDEFVVSCGGYDKPEEKEDVLGRIVKNISAPLHLGGRELVVTASLGCAVYPEDARTGEELIRMADMAMYNAKRERRNTWRLFRPAMDLRRKEHFELTSDLRIAITEKQFILEYQPRVEARSREIRSVEALIRWQHPERGLLSPGAFIGVAEDTGLILEVGAWVVEEAVRQIAEWAANGLPILPVSINVSPLQLRDKGFKPFLLDTVRAAGLRPGQLELEITESILMDGSLSTSLLSELREAGLRLSIDDFGTGYSGLGYLAKFPVDVVKVDRMFTQDIAENPAAAAICRSIIQLAHELHLHTVAEGVERESQAALLREWNCDELQGYYFGYPLSGELMTDLLRMSQIAKSSQR